MRYINNENINLEKGKFNIKKLSILIPILIGLIAILIEQIIPNEQAFVVYSAYTVLLVIIISILIVLFILSFGIKILSEKLTHYSPLLAAGFIVVIILDLVTSKFGILPKPFYPGPDKIIGSIVLDWSILLKSLLYSLRLLVIGYFTGSFLGLISGIAIGWNKKVNYWLNPIVKIIGPIPASAWIPIAMTAFPTSFTASIFLIVLAVWFPVTVMTSNGIANVPNAYFEVARTLGAKRGYLIFRVAIPSAFPMIFIGLFMGIGLSFITLVVSEMLGVKAGLGWYINWVQGWGEYGKVWGALTVISIVFSGIISLLFKIKDRVLLWQKGLIKW